VFYLVDNLNLIKFKGKIRFHIALYLVFRAVQSVLHVTPQHTCSTDTFSPSLGRIQLHSCNDWR